MKAYYVKVGSSLRASYGALGIATATGAQPDFEGWLDSDEAFKRFGFCLGTAHDTSGDEL